MLGFGTTNNIPILKKTAITLTEFIYYKDTR